MRNSQPRILCLVILIGVLMTLPANAGKLYQLQLQWRGPVVSLPADVQITVRDNKNATIKGTSSTTFDGTDLLNYSSDDVLTIVGVGTEGGEIFVNYSVNGFGKKGTFPANSAFEVTVNGSSNSATIHTSCSQPLPLNTAFVGSPTGDFIVTNGVGACLPGAAGCPAGNKLFELDGEFRVTLGACSPTNISLKLKEKNNIKGTSTANFNGFNGSSLDNIVCDDVACLTDVEVDGNDLVIKFDSFGYKPKGDFGASTDFILDLGSCGAFTLVKSHTSCSRAIILHQSMPAGAASVIFREGCGACLVFQTVPVEERAWGTVKMIYRED